MHQTNKISPNYEPEEEDQDWIGIWDRTNPLSVYSRVPNRFRESLDAIPEQIRVMDEETLLKRSSPSAAVGDARLHFWDIFKNTSTKMKMTEVFKCRNTFYVMIECPYKFMWFLTPPADFLTSQKSVLERSLEVLRRFVTGDNMWTETTIQRTDKEGNLHTTTKKEINVKAVAEARKVMESMTDRIHGAVAMNLKVQGQHQHLHTPTPAEQLQGMDASQILSLGDAPPPKSTDVVDITRPEPEIEYAHKFKKKRSFYGSDEKEPVQDEDPVSEFMDEH